MDVRIKRALTSVSDKTKLAELAIQLNKLGIEIISTGGTLNDITDAGVPAIKVSDYTGLPEMMDGRLKTLHPKIHGSILFLRNNEKHIEALKEKLGAEDGIDLVVVSLYPFQETLAKPDATEAELIEKIDIGGPTMIRGAAKNYEFVTVITSPDDYNELIRQLKENDCSTTLDFRRECARKAFTLTAEYDAAIAGYFTCGKPDENNPLPLDLFSTFIKKSGLRYGENPHQQAALYSEPTYPGISLARAELLSGKELSFNNLWDLEAALHMILDFREPFAAVIKHTNPCGAAVGSILAQAYQKALDCDPMSAFGSVIGLNRPVDLTTAKLLHETHFIECIIAPSFEPEALELLRQKKARRLVAVGDLTQPPENYLEMRRLLGGTLAQTRDTREITSADLRTVTAIEPTVEQIVDLLFAFKMVKHVKSNAILISKDGATLGIGAGQTSRVDSSIIAVRKAGNRAKGAVAASDAFFPMPDGLTTLTDAGVTAVIQPGGSKGDPDAIEAANKAGIAMVFTDIRHFKH